MKKIIAAFSAVVALTLFTGCGKNKTLKCTLTQDFSGYKTEIIEEISFKGNDVTGYDAEYIMELDEDYMTYKDILVSTFKTQMSNYKNIDGVSLETKETNSGVKVTMSANVKKMTDENLKKVQLSKKASYSATKENREKSGYKCK